MSKKIDFSEIELSYEGFRNLARDDSLSMYEQIGFPDHYRTGYEEKIFADITGKLDLLSERHKTVVDIGPGCSELPSYLIKLCEEKEHQLVLVDSPEMLSKLPDKPFIKKVPGLYPKNITAVSEACPTGADVLLCYSVFHYIFVDSNVWDFIDNSIQLLRNGGEFLIGDIPNVSKRKRFFSSPRGVAFHQQFMNTSEKPVLEYNKVESRKIDDAVVMAIVARAQAAGCDGYILPQMRELPMHNRRDDLLIRKP